MCWGKEADLLRWLRSILAHNLIDQTQLSRPGAQRQQCRYRSVLFIFAIRATLSSSSNRHNSFYRFAGNWK